MIFPLIIIGKIIIFFSRLFNLGRGGTWPGEIALRFYPQIFSYYINKLNKGLILIAGTNGKTTTAKMISQILGDSEKIPNRIIHNDSGANLINGLVSTLIENVSWFGKLEVEYAIFEVDEAVLPIILNELSKYKKKLIIILINLFRDQLDRYGEVDLIAAKWKKSLLRVSKETLLILNADDPQIAYLGQKIKCQIQYFGIDNKRVSFEKPEHATDSVYCRACGEKLKYNGFYLSHLGVWYCDNCGNQRPKPTLSHTYCPLPGLYNQYNALAATLAARNLGISDSNIRRALDHFKPAFGRQEEFVINKKRIQIFLSKNPAGFNASLKTVLELKPKIILLILNDRIPDGRDVSWIWDVDFETIPENIKIIVSGDRVYDMGLRIKYTMQQCNNLPAGEEGVTMKQLLIIENLKESINQGLDLIRSSETLFILPTYSAMLEVRKILTGKKIL